MPLSAKSFEPVVKASRVAGQVAWETAKTLPGHAQTVARHLQPSFEAAVKASRVGGQVAWKTAKTLPGHARTVARRLQPAWARTRVLSAAGWAAMAAGAIQNAAQCLSGRRGCAGRADSGGDIAARRVADESSFQRF